MSRSADRSPLRRLALAYAAGQLPREVYVQERRRFLDALAAGEPIPDPHPAPASDSGSETLTRARRRVLGAAALTDPPLAWRGHPWLLALGAGGLVLAAAALLWYGWDEGADPQVPASPAAVVPAPAPRGSAAVDLIDALLREGRWGAAERERFLRAWQQQDAADRAAARQGLAFARLAEELRGQMDAERAAGSDEAALQGLLAFVQALGIEPAQP